MERLSAIANASVWPDESPPPYVFLVENIQGIDGLWFCLLSDRGSMQP